MATAHASSVSGAAGQGHETAIENKDFWSKAAEGYNSLAKFPLHCARAGLDAAKVQPEEKFLDVACGPGDLAIDAAKRFGAIVDCIDFSEGMIDMVSKKLEKEPVAVTAHVMNGQSLEFEDASFDVVCSAFGVMLFPDWQKGLKEMVRVTKSGGRVLLVVPDANSKKEPGLSVMELWIRVLEEQFPETLPLPIPKGVSALGREDLMREVLSSEGLQHIQIAQVPFTFTIDDPEALAKTFVLNPFFVEVQKRLSEERCAELATAVAKGFHESKLEDGSCGRRMFGLTGVGYKP